MESLYNSIVAVAAPGPSLGLLFFVVGWGERSGFCEAYPFSRIVKISAAVPESSRLEHDPENVKVFSLATNVKRLRGAMLKQRTRAR
jgi:hypothetical protein